MRQSRDWLRTHTVTVETYSSEGFTGAGYSAPVDRLCGLEDAEQMSRGDAGDEATSGGRLFCPLSDLPFYPPETRLTIRPGRTARVTSVEVRESHLRAFADLDHLEVHYA